MHPVVIGCCVLQGAVSYRVTFIEYYTKYLAKAAALLAAQAPVSAMRLFDREHQNIHEIVRWASQGPLEEALPFYSDILWESMPLLSGRLDLLQREVFCKVQVDCRSVDHQSVDDQSVDHHLRAVLPQTTG